MLFYPENSCSFLESLSVDLIFFTIDSIVCGVFRRAALAVAGAVGRDERWDVRLLGGYWMYMAQ